MNREENVCLSNNLSKPESKQFRDENLSASDDLGIGSMVEVSMGGEPHYGVIKFIGPIKYGSRIHNAMVAGIEMVSF